MCYNECMKLDLTHQTFGKLTAIRRVDNRGRRTRWLCQCECGNETIVRTHNLRSGHTQSCGCLHIEVITKHGMEGTPTYNSYHSMIQRCTNKNNDSYPNYGGRGIVVCDRWSEKNGFLNFVEDMGERPEGTSIDRLDTNGNYTPNNCRWVDDLEQNRNTLDGKWWFVDGIRYNSSYEAANYFGVSAMIIRQWCIGYTHYGNGKTYPPTRPNCWVEPKYT